MFNFTKKLKLIIPIILIAIFIIANFALAQVSIPITMGGTFGLGTQNIYGTIIKIVNVFLGFLGVLAISIILYGGFIWMTSGGFPEKIEKAKKILINAVIGLGIILLSFVIVQFVKITTNSGTSGVPTCNIDNVGTCNNCNRCIDLGNPGPYVWNPDTTCDPSCNELPISFKVTAIVPGNDSCVDGVDITYPLNSVIRIYFTKPVLDTVANINAGIILNDTGLNSQCVGDPFISTPYDFTVNGNIVEIRPKSGTCPDNSCGADRCFQSQSTINIKAVIGTLQDTDGKLLTDNLVVDEDVQFFTNNAVDCSKPVVNLLSNSQICLGVTNNLGSSAQDDNGVAQVEFSDNNGGSAFVGATTISCPGPGLCGQDPASWVIPLGSGPTWTPTEPSYTVGADYIVKIQASDLDSNITADSRTFTLRESHCCNDTQDADEVGIDCGGADCALCSGAACGYSDNLSCSDSTDCVANDNLCSSNICGCTNDEIACSLAGYDVGVNPCCLCQSPPLIDCVTPSDLTGDPSGCLDPVGTVGTLLTLWGRDFGTYVPGVSTVTIAGVKADLAETVNSSCSNSWTDTQIVVVVPSGVGAGGSITVNSANGYSDSTNDTQGVLINDFQDDGKNRPSLCTVKNIESNSLCFSNNCGYFQEKIQGEGIGISSDDVVEFGNEINSTPGLFSLPIPDFLIQTQVPNISPGTVGFRVLSISGEYSNYLNFNVKTTPGGPHIDYIEPNTGPEGQYITVYGNNLGSTPAGNSLTFGGVNGDFNFPTDCGPGDYWQNNHIIVKVPTGLSVGSNDVVVTVGTIPSNAVPFNTCLLDSVSCPLLSGMCKLQPNKGPWNTLVDIWGENFGGNLGSIKFYDNTFAPSVDSWTNKKILKAKVPNSNDSGGGAKTGPIYVISSDGNYSSNSLPFEVGNCVANTDCPDSTTDVCCGGACYTDSCPTPNYSTYTWSFTTGDYFIDEQCDENSPPASPTPWDGRSGGQDVCVNTGIAVKFTEPVVKATVDTTTVFINECAGPINNPCSVLNPVAGTLNYIDYDTDFTNINGFTFNPLAVLKKNSWYQVILKGGVGNITAVANNTPLIDDYIWTFKTRNSIDWCRVDKVDIVPNPAKLVDINSSQNFIALPLPANKPCFILNGLLYNYSWSSVDTEVATVAGSVTDTEIATPVLSGKTKIQATVLPDNITGQAELTVDFNGMVITDHWYECEEVCSNTSLGARFDREVETTTLTTGSGKNVNIYSCADGQSCNNYLGGLIDLKPVDASYIWDVVSGNSEASFDSIIDLDLNKYYRVVLKGGLNGIKGSLGSQLMSLNANLAYGEECDPGVSANCNFSTCLWSGNACDTNYQECVNSDSSSLLDGCNNNCYHSGSVITTCGNGIVDLPRESCDYQGMCSDTIGNIIGDGTVGNPHTFCQTDADCGGNTCIIADNNGCNNLCLLTGSTNTAVCGDGKIEWGEACDDNNQTNGDGCNDHCLREGRAAEINITYTGICGNGTIERTLDGVGEDCDDGNNISGDGCSADCLSEGSFGSVCGDGVVGIGEDCDNQKGCDPTTCLWSGSSGEAQCGNNIIEDSKNDSFSWVFKTKSVLDDSCSDLNVQIIPDATTMLVNERKNFKVVVRTAANECDGKGQSLNPWDFNWSWWSDDATVAKIFTTCGNGVINVGEDCDNGGQCNDGTPCNTGGNLCDDGSVCQVPGGGINGCTFNCLNDGGSLTCGNGIIEDGEDCDDGNTNNGDGCSLNCLHEGNTTSLCGNNIIDISEDCDDGNTNNGDGCNSSCLNEGIINNQPNQKVEGINVGNTIIHAQESGNNEGTSAITVNEAVGPVACQIDDCPDCNTGVLNCGSIYSCEKDPNPPDTTEICDDLGQVSGCFCCCDPEASVDTCGAVGLKCIPDQAPCTGGSRGQCCGAESNNDCLKAGLDPFVGDDTCCHTAPIVNSNIPDGGVLDVCRNTLITATFDTQMDTTTFDNNFELAKRYDATITPTCPNGEIPSSFIPSTGAFIYCVVPGNITNREDIIGTVLEFSSKDILDPGVRYYATIYGDNSNLKTMTCGNRKVEVGEDCDDGNNINGDGCSLSCLHEGNTTSLCGNGKIDIGEDCDSTANCGPTCLNIGTAFPICGNGVVEDGEDCDDGNINNGDGCASNCLNEGTALTGVRNTYTIPMQDVYQWFFQTGDEICKINDIKITSIVGNGEFGRITYDKVKSDLFICSGLDDGFSNSDTSNINDSYCYRDALRPNEGNIAVPDNPNMPGNQHIYQVRPFDQFGYQLSFSSFNWFWKEDDIDNVFLLHNVSDLTTADLTGTKLAVTSNSINGQGYIDISATSTDSSLGQITKRFSIRVFLCSNPWPDISWWPWEDNITANSSADCDNVMGGCEDNFFDLFYCRDYGEAGPADDLPKISDNPMIFGKSDKTDIVKEFLFVQDDSGSGGPLITDAYATPCKGSGGTIFYIEARVIDMDGVNSIVAHIQQSDGVDIATINLDDATAGVVGDNLYGANWNSGSFCGGNECSYFIDIVADDSVLPTPNETVLDNIACSG